MPLPDWKTLALDEGVLPEPAAGGHSLVLWLRGERAGGFQHWERVGGVANAAVTRHEGLCATTATAVQVRQRLRGFFGRLLDRFRPAPGGRTWLLPGGEAAEQVGERQTDLILAWAEGEGAAPEEARVRACWPLCRRVRQVGANLFLVWGVEPAQEERGPPATACEPRAAAEQLLALARRRGDRRREIAALTDLGVVHARACDGKKALAALEEALALARASGEVALEDDVVANLGSAALLAGQPARALALLEEGLARAAGNPYAEKSALERLGEAYARLRDPVQALEFYGRALVLAREVGDHQHAADLLWLQGIQHAELGQRDQAVGRAEEAIVHLRTVGNPQAGWLADELQKYRTGAEGERLGGGRPAEPVAQPVPAYGSQDLVGGWGAAVTSRQVSVEGARGPGLLRMALAGVKSLAKFLASGFKTVGPALHQKRLETCASCEHHTGLRCRLCGCFTNAKAWLPHERCPLGKWPA